MTSISKKRIESILSESRLKPPYSHKSLITRFMIFQNERVPLLALLLVSFLLTSAISKSADLFNWKNVVISSLMIILYFLQIRLADEPKDFEHDNKFYPNRPVQRGVITLGELSIIKNIVIIVFLILSFFTGSWYVVALAFFQQLYSFLTRKEFFIRDWLRNHFLTYQFSHYVQLFILAWLVLTIIGLRPLDQKIIYFAYSMFMIALIESSRTLGGEDNKKAKDRYSYRLGTWVALSSFIFFVVIVSLFTYYLSTVFGGAINPLSIIVMTLGLIAVILSLIKYCKKPVTKNAELLNISSVIFYICSTLAILLN